MLNKLLGRTPDAPGWYDSAPNLAALQHLAPEGCGCDTMQYSKAMVSIDEALACIAAKSHEVTGTEEIALVDGIGRVLAAPVRSHFMAPPFDNAAMDGYAVDTSTLTGHGPWTLSVSDRVAAGQAPAAPVTGMTAARVFTGAPIPAGADAVVMQENTVRIGEDVRLFRRPEAGLNIRRAGSDMAAGETILRSGQHLEPRAIAACAAAGIGSVTLHRRIRVALLVTGDEIRQVGDSRQVTQIWDVNTPMLAAILAKPGIDLIAPERGADSRNGLRSQLADLSARADLVITTGGISVGEADHVKPALGDLGAEVFFSGVAIKPGKPVSFGRVGSALWMGLPGNPLSAFVTWQLFGTALVRKLAGHRSDNNPRRHVITAHAIRRKAGRCELRPATLAGFDALGREIMSFEDATHSGRVSRLPFADGLMFLPAEIEHLPQGALVEFQPFCQT